jgi:predicted lipoprotein with Yx(FWY)xxD motif
MKRTALARAAAVAAAVGAMAALAVAPSTAGAAATPKTATEISAVKNSKLGTILVADTTVYALKASKTACNAACLKIWPPVLLPDGVMMPTAGTGVDQTKLGTTTTSTGAMQVTYSGKPLFWYYKDTAPGMAKGNLTDKWGKWYTVTATGKASSGSGSNNTNAGSGGSGF